MEHRRPPRNPWLVVRALSAPMDVIRMSTHSTPLRVLALSVWQLLLQPVHELAYRRGSVHAFL